MKGDPWLLLLHQIPPRPAYGRAQALRRLAQVGALPVKNSAYLLPDTAEALEDFQWIYQEITEQGGNAWLFRTELLAGFTGEQIQQLFRNLREVDYQKLIEEARALLEAGGPEPPDGIRPFGRLVRRFEELKQIDFFQAPGREKLDQLMREIENRLHSPSPDRDRPELDGSTGKCWVTRRGVKVDRIGSAWLIRRFIDPTASFRFVDPNQYTQQGGEVRFDMLEGEFTHEGDLCTFEVLIQSAQLVDPALLALAEIVHDIDLKDQRYQRPETAGVALLLEGICLPGIDDGRRLERGCTLFDSLYESLKRMVGPAL